MSDQPWNLPLATATRHRDEAFDTDAGSLRPFGWSREDLEVDFELEDRPRLVTQILSACLSRPDGSPLACEHVWNLTVSRRIEYLLHLAALSGGFTGRVRLRCPQVECRQSLEIDLPITEIIAVQRKAEKQDRLDWGQEPNILRFRRPTGDDQRGWQKRSFANIAQARAAIVQSLLVAANETGPIVENLIGLPPAEFADTIENSLEDFDPLVAFSVRVCCPQCSVETDLQVDLEALALTELKRIQIESFHNIHRLASAYHWSEAEILCLSSDRRTRYLTLIEEVP
jgi:hypothetical protein